MKSIRVKLIRSIIFASLLALMTSKVYANTTTTIVDSFGTYTSLALNSSGFPVISYDASGSLKVAVCGNAACSTGNTLTTVDSAGFVGWFTSLALNNSGFPVISYYADSGNSLKVAVCGNATCSAGNTLTTLDGGSVGDVGWYTSLALNSYGFPVISYYDLSNGDLKVAICGNATCSAGNTLTTVDSAGDVGRHTSLVLNNNNFPVISYYDFTNHSLKVAICGNPTCSAGNTLTTVDSGGGVFWGSTSLALNSSGFPVISYSDDTNSVLKVAICGNTTCSAGNTLTTVDNVGIWGSDTSLALNSSGFPVISYSDDTNGVLKVAVCGNATCSTGNTLITVDSGAGQEHSLALNSSGLPIISYPANRGLKVAVLDNAAPKVARQSLSASYTTGPSSFTVTFNEDVNDPSGNTDANDVTNPANYLLVEAGANGTFDTESCKDGLSSDDTKMTINNISYNSTTFISTVNVNNGIALPAGKYKLFVCGTTSITDLALNKLNNGTSDYTFDFVVEAGASLPKTGFTPNRITALPIQPAQLAYANLDSIWLEIPSLKIKTNIVGVPKTDEGWDVNWLGQDAGWLNSTAFPSWEGNSIITAHVTDANGLPGPFANLKNLKYGDRIIVHIYGQKYIFEVQSSRMVRPTNTKSAIEHLEGHSYLTLITCQSYNPLSDSYLFRRVVRAVLVAVK